MGNKKLQLDKLAKEAFTGTQVGVLLEDIDQKLGFIGEKVGSIETRLDRVETKLDATFEAVADIKIEFTGLKEKDDELDRRVIVLEKKVAI